MIVGTPGTENANVLDLSAGAWTHTGTMTPSGLAPNSFAGASGIAIDGHRAAIGADVDHDGATADVGAVWF